MGRGAALGRMMLDVRPGLYLVAAICGLIDVTCMMALGGVFAEMMTGNLLLMSIDVGSGGTFARSSRYLWPLAAFGLGAILGGRLLHAAPDRFGRAIGFVLVWFAIAGSAAVCWRYEPNGRETLGHAITAVLAFGMGLQTAILRRHGVRDLATNVMTLTFTAVLADSRLAGGSRENMLRRVLSIVCFFSGGVTGAMLVRHGTVYPLSLAAGLLCVRDDPVDAWRATQECSGLTAGLNSALRYRVW